MAHTRPWSSAYEATPAGDTGKLRDGDDRIRDLKTDIRERIALEHKLDPTAPDDTDDGRHTPGEASVLHVGDTASIAALSPGADYIGALAIDTEKRLVLTWDGTNWQGFAQKGYRNGSRMVWTRDASSFTLKAGEIEIDGVVRVNTGDTTVDVDDLDTGEIAEAYYYIYAIADADVTTFSIKYSLVSNDAPSGVTDPWREIGWFWNGTAETFDVESLGDYDYSHITQVIGTSNISAPGSYETMTNMLIKYVSDGIRPCWVLFNAPVHLTAYDADTLGYIKIDIGGQKVVTTLKGLDSHNDDDIHSTNLSWVGVLSAGTHNIVVQWYHTGETVDQLGTTHGNRVLQAITQ